MPLQIHVFMWSSGQIKFVFIKEYLFYIIYYIVYVYYLYCFQLQT